MIRSDEPGLIQRLTVMCRELAKAIERVGALRTLRKRTDAIDPKQEMDNLAIKITEDCIQRAKGVAQQLKKVIASA